MRKTRGSFIASMVQLKGQDYGLGNAQTGLIFHFDVVVLSQKEIFVQNSKNCVPKFVMFSYPTV